MDKFRTKDMDELFKGILTLKDIDECYKFFYDICTIKELMEISQRFQVAKLLDQGGRSYAEIRDITGASTATITRINRSLKFGNDGYLIAISRLKENQ